MFDRALSKSLYLSALHCDRRVWLDVHAPEEGAPPSEVQRYVLGTGRAVGRAAEALFPGGVRVEPPSTDHAVAIEQTRALMARPAIPAIFEAAFEADGVRIRVDVLERLRDEQWGLREVKSSTSVKRARHLPDLALQRWVLERCGVDVTSAEIVHLNGDYVRAPGGIDWQACFRRVEWIEALTDPVREGSEDGVRDVPARICAVARTLDATTPPERLPGSFCRKPHLCRYWESCTADKPSTWFLEQAGGSPEHKARMADATETDRPWVSKQLERKLEGLAPPVWALDFEAISPPIPRFLGTRPYQTIVFQWSLHRLGETGEVEHFEYLADGQGDPRVEVMAWLIEILERDRAPVLVYSGYEGRCLREITTCGPEMRRSLDAIEARLVDLLPIVRNHIYHPAFKGSFSIKRVAPALASSVTYEDLDGIADGAAAMGVFERIMSGLLDRHEERAARKALLAYCERDTWALLELYRALRGAAGFES